MPLIESLTPEQEALIPVYREKWRRIALSTEPIERQKSTVAVKAAYALIGKQEPDMIFCDSPDAADKKWEELVKQLPEQLSGEVSRELEDELWNKLVGQLCNEIRSQLGSELDARLWDELVSWMGRELTELEHHLCIYGWCINFGDDWATNACLIDFCLSVLNLNCFFGIEEPLLLSVVKYCGIIYPFEEIAFVCDRPRILSFDSQQRLHAEGSPAIQFADGFSVYAFHGVRLP